MRKLLAHAGIIAVLLAITAEAPGALSAGYVAQATRPIRSDLRPTSPPQPTTKSVTVPSVTGKPVRAAFADVNNVGLVPVVKPATATAQAFGMVVAQDPPAGAEVSPRSRVVLSVILTELAIQPGTTVDEATSQTRVWGQLIVHRDLTVDLKAQTQHVPLLAVTYQGMDRVRGDQPEALNFAEPRTIGIVERLSVAWVLLDSGGTLEVTVDDSMPPNNTSIWRLTDPLGPLYGRPEPQSPAIYLRHPSLGGNSLKILTVYPEDAFAFGQPDDAQGVPTPLTARELADYLVALLKAHHLLFHRQSTDLEKYDQLDICRTKDGRVFKEIAAKIRPSGAPGEPRDLKGVLEQLPMDQRVRLATLAYKAPTDWRLRDRP